MVTILYCSYCFYKDWVTLLLRKVMLHDVQTGTRLSDRRFNEEKDIKMQQMSFIKLEINQG